MVQHWIVRTFASTALIVLASGCAAPSTGAGASLSDPAAAIAANQLSGIWRGSFWTVGAWSSSAEGEVTLEIKDDATYSLISTGRGTATNESGVVMANGRDVTLKSSTGRWTRLTRNGDALHGMATSAGFAITIMVERAR